MKNQKVRKKDILNEKEFYKRKIIEMINQIDNEKYLKMIYGFVKRLHKE